MPKSRHSHRKPKPKRKQITPATPVSTQQSVAQPAQPALSAKVAVSKPAATAVAKQYPYIVTELKNIGIVTGIILVILVVLYRVVR